MCSSPPRDPLDFSDLENPADLQPGGAAAAADPADAAATYLEHQVRYAAARGADPVRYPCPRCRGTGIYTWGYRNPGSGPCHACRGRGYHLRSPAQRERSRTRRAERRARIAGENSDAAKQFLKSRPDIRAWLAAGEARGNGFAMSLGAALYKYGEWTERQLAAVEASLERQRQWRAEREQKLARERAGASTAPVAPDSGIDLSAVPDGWYAVPDGDTRLKIRIKRPAPPSRWAGWVFVSDGAGYGHGRNYGRQAPGGRYAGEIADALRAVAADPRAASAAYGRLVGRCGVCGRLLEDAVSVAAGIGPVCAGRLGW